MSMNKKPKERIDVRLSKAKIDTAIATFGYLKYSFTINDLVNVTGLSKRTISKYYKKNKA